jgi:hypothetical protein
MGCLIKMVKNKGALKNISFIKLQRVPNRDNKYIDSERNQVREKYFIFYNNISFYIIKLNQNLVKNIQKKISL